MNSVPARQRGAASGMLATFQNSGFVLSIGIFFSLMIAGLASTLPTTLTNGLTAHGVPHALAAKIGAAPPVSSLFAAFLGYNPVHQLLAPTGVLARLPAHQVSVLTGKRFFPELLSGPFHHGLVIVFGTAMFFLIVAAVASALRGGRYVYDEQGVPAATGPGVPAASAAANGQPANGSQQSASNGTGQSSSGDGQAAAKEQPAP
jgi:hypothetical protein